MSAREKGFYLNENSMKKILSIVVFLLFLISCGKSVVEKPDNLIGKDKMVDIIYDLSLLDALKSQRPIYLEQNNINPRKYIYDKYKIDSLQFVNSNKYYASDFAEYKNIYDKVQKRLEDTKKVSDSLMKAQGVKPAVVAPEQGVVR